jgi:hypothetical protein
LLESVRDGKETIIMEKKEKPIAVVIDPDATEQQRREDDADWAVIERLQERNADADPEQVLADATAAVEEVRQEMYAETRRHRTAGSR